LDRFKYVIAIGLVAVLVSASAVNVALSTLPTPTVANYNKLGQVRDCTFLISTDGTNIYSQNCNTGAIEYSGTDATTVIKNSIDAASTAGGGTVSIKAGTYNIAANIKPASNVMVKGEGIDATILQVTGSNGIFVKNDSTAMNDFVIMDMTLDGQGVAQKLINFASNAQDFKIIRVKAMDNAEMLAFQVGDVIDSIFDTNSGGFDMVAGVYAGSQITGNVFRNGGAQGLTSGSAQNVTITDNYFYNIATKAISLESISTAINKVIIANNVFEDVDDFNIQLNNSGQAIGNVTITNNVGNGLIRIGASGASNGNIVIGNVFTGVEVTGHDNLIEGNRFSGRASSAIGITTGSSGNRVIGNYISEAANNGILVTAADNNTIIGNVIKHVGTATNNTYDGIQLVNSGATTPDGNIVSGNTVVATVSGNNMRYGINHASGSKNIITDNQIIGTFATASGNLAGGGASTAIVSHNTGFVTENRGTATISSASTSVTITHGLSFTPAATQCTVEFTENPTNDPGNSWLSGFSSTQFTVNVRSDPGASNLDLSWHCVRN
jgi:parallel beta-helix repeat protein